MEQENIEMKAIIAEQKQKIEDLRIEIESLRLTNNISYVSGSPLRLSSLQNIHGNATPGSSPTLGNSFRSIGELSDDNIIDENIAKLVDFKLSRALSVAKEIKDMDSHWLNKLQEGNDVLISKGSNKLSDSYKKMSKSIDVINKNRSVMLNSKS